MYRYFDVHSHKNSTQSVKNDVLIVENIRISSDPITAVQAPYFSIGIHPYDVEKATPDWSERLPKVATDRRCVAIGECGVDKRYPDLNAQIKLLEQQINISNELQKPIVIHCVRAENEILNALKASTQSVIFHGYPHFNKQLERGGNIYFSLGQRALQSAQASKIPTNRVLMETDESLMPIEELYSRYAAKFNVDNIEFEEMIRNNFHTIFKIS